MCVSGHRCRGIGVLGQRCLKNVQFCAYLSFFNIDLMKTLTQCNASIYTKEKALLLPGMEDNVERAGALLQLISASRSNHLKIT